MSDEEKKEPQENQDPGGAPESNAAPTEAELEAIKAELEEERKAKAAGGRPKQPQRQLWLRRTAPSLRSRAS